ncbi:unnamed protein product [Kluyveromyces dobzhanskii CBS 2104]|uniref:WGS project CCBQ000000000 data, contig 00058 n=1 Tax=Kluyveromyces dobzhanskii CBS 2104 TaxID=1427455 RepID=A0A0A8LDM4_9SACH|nr:unnamed protein product [Kluyveromyces dobzhanskii CBS 2104]
MYKRGATLLVSHLRKVDLRRSFALQTPIVEKLKVSLLNDKTIIETESLPTTNKRSKQSDRGGRETRNSLPPSLQYVRDVMDKYTGHVVITQIGSFYELYFEHATLYAPMLNITLTSKSIVSGRVPFAGFPLNQLNRQLKVLVKQYGYSVAVCDQFKHESSIDNDKNRFMRRVTRIVTPGTFIDEAFENFQENQFILTLEFPENCMKRAADLNTPVGLSWCDISTGEIFVQQVYLKDLVSSITRIRPMEVLLDEKIMPVEISNGEWYAELTELKKYFVKYQKMPAKHRPIQSFFKLFSKAEGDIAKVLDNFTQKEVAAFRNLLLYIEEHLPDMNTNLELPQKQLITDIMQIDSRTSTALELHSTMREQHKKGSLLSTIRRTVTTSGARLLTQWLSAPSMNINEIKKRQSLVLLFKNNEAFTESLVRYLKETSDMSRIIQRFSFGRGDPLELVQLAKSLRKCNEISAYLQEDCQHSTKKTEKVIHSITNKLKFEDPIVEKVLSSLNEESLIKQRTEKFEDQDEDTPDSTKSEDQSALAVIMRSDSSPLLKKYHKQYNDLAVEKERLSQWYKEWFQDRFNFKSVTLKQKNSGEYCIHLTGTTANLIEFDKFIQQQDEVYQENCRFHVIQKSKQTRWLVHDKWENLSKEIEVARILIRNEEERMINQFQKDFISLSSKIRSLSQVLDYLDVLTSFAKLANEQRLVLPKITQGTELEIKGGRHLVVEAGISQMSLESFTSNDCQIDSGELWVITGPNMGGKSTFLRQNAIIVILAQIGSFVPCESAVIGLVDKIFSRVGSADDLYNEMSTFMVEMIETSYILKGATNRSMAILDEIGRGTSRSEGVAIAYATLKYLVTNNACRALFATHFGTELSNTINNTANKDFIQSISFYKTGIIGDDSKFYYDHKLKPGICSKSDAIKVAKLAGFPKEALEIADSVLNEV